MEEKLEKIMSYRRVLNLLEQERKILQEQKENFGDMEKKAKGGENVGIIGINRSNIGSVT